MENYQMNRPCGRPYNATCGMAKEMMSGQQCSCRNNSRNQPSRPSPCPCHLPDAKTRDAEMYTHIDQMEEFPTAVCIKCRNHFPTVMQTILWKERWAEMMYRNQCTAKEKLMNRINEVSFAVNDVLLYLDTHPCCEEAISFYQECEQERQKLLKEYAQCYGPLTVDAALESGGDTWKWVQQPFPWETEGGCRQFMWNYEKRLQYPVNIKTPNAKIAQFIMSQYGGPDCNTL